MHLQRQEKGVSPVIPSQGLVLSTLLSHLGRGNLLSAGCGPPATGPWQMRHRVQGIRSLFHQDL